jgi:tetratricopeptide (TPR) repeat protein
MSFDRIGVTALAAAACIGVALACGPNFPWQLLDSREETVSAPVELNFAFEVSRLVSAPKDSLRAVESDRPVDDEAVTAEREELQSGAWRGLMPAATDDWLMARLEAARRADSGDAAKAAAAGVPVAVADYLAGAAEYHAGRLDAALAFFQAIDRLPAEQRNIRTVWAAYMCGRVHQRLGQFASARADFQATRRHAEAGAPDPIGLAVASLGEEARLDLIEAGLIESPWPGPEIAVDDAAAPRLIANAVRLYADQANRGSKAGLLSLGEVARRLMDPDLDRRRILAEPIVRRLLVAYVASKQPDYTWDDTTDLDTIVAGTIERVLSQPAPEPGPDLDRLAALAYQGGRYDLAEKLSEKASQPLGLWVRAKLALRRGDRGDAVKDWMAALTAAGQDGPAVSLDQDAKARLRGEVAVMRLSQGEYRDSLQLLFPVAETYWGDVIYIAERVLTVDELKAFVDGLPPPSAPEARSDRPDPVANLRALLARRLVRVGQASEAVAYFPPRLTGSAAEERDADRADVEDARNYLAAIDAIRPGWFEWPWQKVSRAEAMFKLARMTRVQGMGLMGTEGPPDETVMYGAFPSGIGQTSPNGEGTSPSPLLGPDEASRFAASAPKPDTRFHYRPIAADRALAAADLLPQRSQAYAATLCWAARYATASRDEARAQAIYQRYVSTGAYQPWAKAFGGTCPPPDFEAAKTFWQRRVMGWIEKMAGSAWRHGGLLLAMAVVLCVLFVVWRRRNLRGAGVA